MKKLASVLGLCLVCAALLTTGCGPSGPTVVAPPSDEAAQAAQQAANEAYDKELAESNK